MDMFLDFLILGGKTYDCKVLCQSFASLLPLPQGSACSIRLRFEHAHPTESDLINIWWCSSRRKRRTPQSDEDIAKYNKSTKVRYTYSYPVFSGLWLGKKIVGSASFQSRDGHPGFKANPQGNLFLLERHIFFISKQPTLIEINYIRQVILSRAGAGDRTNLRP
ncbi:hypothetical protein BYT27DRAFT_6549675 [Phlegmacium glaucopus]|nr:hypothetical protein BYT27DRAFT_6549675 [Phlegmacium glaucopus]